MKKRKKKDLFVVKVENKRNITMWTNLFYISVTKQTLYTYLSL